MSWRYEHCGFSSRARQGARFGPAAPYIAIASSVLGTGLSIAGQSQKAQADAAQAAYQAQVARNNQALMEINARQAEAQGESDAERQELQTSQLEGRQRAALAAQGGDVNSGSNLDLLGDTARAGATDIATIRNNAAWKAYGYRVAGLGDEAVANADDSAAANATASLPFGIGSSLLGGASRVADKWKAAFGGDDGTPDNINPFDGSYVSTT